MKKKTKDKISLNVLYLEDSLEDVEILRDLLVEADYDLSMDCTEKKKEFTSLLHSGSYDVILSDFKLPGFDAFGALELSKIISPNVPFICISGSIGEDIAIELIKKGAIDYVLKDRLARLPLAIQRALEEVKEKKSRRQAEEALGESERRFQVIAKNTPVGIFQTDVKGSITYVNPQYCQISGLSQEEAIGIEWLSAVHSDDKEKMNNIWHRTRQKNEFSQVAYRLVRKGGTTAWVIGRVVPEKDIKNNIVSYIGTITDITEHKQAEDALRETENKYKTIFEGASEGILIADGENKKIKYANPTICSMLRYSVDELIGLSINNIHPQEFLPDILAEFESVSRDEVWFVQSIPCLRKDGTIFFAEINTAKVVIEGIPCNVGFFTDITERRRAEEVMRERDIQFRKFASQVPGMLYQFILKPDGSFCVPFTSESIQDIFGCSPQEVQYDFSPIAKAIFPEDLNFVVDSIQKSGQQLVHWQCEYRVQLPGQPIRWMYGQSMPEKLDDGSVVWYGFNTDITERKKAEEIIHQSEKQFKTLFMSLSDGFYISEIIYDDKGNPCDYRYIEVNPKFEQIVGLNRDQIVGKRYKEIVPVDTTQWLDNYFTVAQTGVPRTYEFYSEEYHMHFETYSYQPIKGRISVFVRDITERKQAEKALRESEKNYRELIDGMNETVWIIDFNGDLIDVNNASVKILGYSKEELLSIGLYGIDLSLKKEAIKALAQAMPSDKLQIFETTHTTKDGKTFPVEIYSSLVTYQGKKAILSIARDITERKRTEEALRQMQKLEGLGTLAGGIAHDFNNILGIILAYNTSIQQFKNDAKKLNLATETITKAVDRGRTLVQQILTFARKTETKYGPVNVNDVVMEIMTMIFETFPRVLTYAQNFEKGIPFINADRSQVHQSLLNLCVNARDAMPSGGLLSINTRMVPAASLRTQHPNADASSYVCIEVSDTGEGMREETRKRIFEPFFTTKGIGKGTGLGLSVVFGVVQTHKGFIDVESDIGKGTTFRLYLPASLAAEPIVEEEETLEEIPGGTETLLVVEDEEMLMMSLRMVLVEKGYNVLSASDGLEALKVYQEKKNEISLVMTDLGLPTITGLEVSQRIKKVDPKVNIILATGFLDPEMKSQFLEAGIEHFLFKPYELKKVLREIRAVLDGK